MEKLFFSKIPFWAVGLLLVVGLITTILFANVAVFLSQRPDRGGVFREPIMAIGDIRQLMAQSNEDSYLMVTDPKLDGKSGFNFSYAAGSRPDSGYMLLTRFDGDDRRAYAELIDLNAQKQVHRWAPNTDAIFAQSTLKSAFVDLKRDRPAHRMVYRHAFPLEDGGLLVQSLSPLVKVDACSNLVWMNSDSALHHSIERDADGNFFVPSVLEPTQVPNVNLKTFRDDGINQISPDGKTLMTKSVAEILASHNMLNLVHNAGDDPVHLNDIQPVLEDGPYWKKGDLFLSLRTPSMVMLYRPSTDEIIWQHSGLWYAQHDVDILDDHRISVFNNNAVINQNQKSSWRSVATNEVMIYDFSTDTFSSPWKDALNKNQVNTVSEGLATVLPNDELFVEDQNSGRILRLAKDGNVVWEYVNRAEMGAVFRVAWSRFLTNEEAAPIVASIEKANCSR